MFVRLSATKIESTEEDLLENIKRIILDWMMKMAKPAVVFFNTLKAFFPFMKTAMLVIWLYWTKKIRKKQFKNGSW